MSVFTGASAPHIGLTDSPSIARALRSLGMIVHTSDDGFAESGKIIRAALQDRTFPLLVVEEKQLGLRVWTERMSKDHTVVILRGESDARIDVTNARYVTLPSTLGSILTAAGFDVDENDTQLRDVVGPDYKIASSAPSAPSRAERPARAEPVTRRERRIGDESSSSRRRSTSSELDELFADLPVASSRTPFAPSQSPAPEPEEVADAPSWAREPEPEAERPATPEPEPEAVSDAPSWAREASTPEPEVAADAPSWARPDSEPEPEPEEVAVAEPEPVFDDAPLDASFDPDWEPEPEPEVDLSIQPDYRPVTTSRFLPKPEPVEPAHSVTPSPSRATERASHDDDHGIEIVAPVSVSNPEPVAPSAPREKTLDDYLAEVSAVPRPVVVREPEPEPAPVVPKVFEPKKKCPVIVVFASKGGVGKTTSSLTLAQIASEVGLRATLVDGNRGQGGVRLNLRVPDLASVYDAAVQSNPRAALMMPHSINANRPPTMTQVGFAVALAPPEQLSDPRLVTAQVYADVVAYAREVSDIVILDTQIAERFDTTGIIESVAIPAMLDDNGFGLGLTDGSSEGIKNLLTRLDHFNQGVGIPRERLMSLVNRGGLADLDPDMVSNYRKRYGAYSRFLGVVGEDPDFQGAFKAGTILTDSSTLAPALRAVLYRATGDSRFEPLHEEPTARRGFPLFRRRGGRA